MTRKIRQPRRVRQTNHIPNPHSSWTRRDHGDSPAIAIAPDDFWARLGL